MREWIETQAIFAEFRPDLLDEVRSFGPRSPEEFADWLDRKFPHPAGGGWGPSPAAALPSTLREILEKSP